MPRDASITSTSQLRSGSSNSSSRNSHLSGKVTLGFSSLKDSIILILNNWKCFKSTNVFENIKVFWLGSTKALAPGSDSVGMEFLGSAPHLGISCPALNFQVGSAGILLLWLGTEEEHFQKNLQGCNSSQETFLLSL